MKCKRAVEINHRQEDSEIKERKQKTDMWLGKRGEETGRCAVNSNAALVTFYSLFCIISAKEKELQQPSAALAANPQALLHCCKPTRVCRGGLTLLTAGPGRPDEPFKPCSRGNK